MLQFIELISLQIYRYYYESFFDPIAVVAGCVQTILYADFFYLYITSGASFRLVGKSHALFFYSDARLATANVYLRRKQRHFLCDISDEMHCFSFHVSLLLLFSAIIASGCEYMRSSFPKHPES